MNRTAAILVVALTAPAAADNAAPSDVAAAVAARKAEIAAAVAAMPTYPSGWPRLARYGLFVPVHQSGMKPTDDGVGHGVRQNGWGPIYTGRIEPALRSTRRPDAVYLQCFGYTGRSDEGHPSYYVDGFELSREGFRGVPPAPQVTETLQVIPRQCAAAGLDCWLYTGLIHTKRLEELREADPDAWRARFVKQFDFFRGCGFTGVFVDSLSNTRYWRAGHPGYELLGYWNRSGLMRIGVEAWPHTEIDEPTRGMPVWITEWFVGHELLSTRRPLYADNREVVIQIDRLAGENNGLRLTAEDARRYATLSPTGDGRGVTFAINDGLWPEIAPLVGE